jgi:hypothetical protein
MGGWIMGNGGGGKENMYFAIDWGMISLVLFCVKQTRVDNRTSQKRHG